VHGELAKSADERFKEQLSSVLLWVLAGLVPHLMLIDLLSTLPHSRVAKERESHAFVSAPWGTRLAGREEARIAFNHSHVDHRSLHSAIQMLPVRSPMTNSILSLPIAS
jgi:hypothetical protein